MSHSDWSSPWLFVLQTLIVVAVFFLMEIVAYLAHRYVFHGFLWSLHRSHHEPQRGSFELNDLFALFFAPIAVVFMGGWLAPDWVWFTFPVGTGMTLYGLMYLFVHDIYTHRRMLALRVETPWILALRAAHRHHHSNVSHAGHEPYGFLFFGYSRGTKKTSQPCGSTRAPSEKTAHTSPVSILGLFLAVAMLGGTLGCSILGKSLLEQPKVELASVSVKGMTSAEAIVVFGVKVDNPNSVSLRVDRLNYDIDIGDKPFSKGQLDKAAEVTGHNSAVIEVPVAVKYRDVLSSLLSFIGKGSSKYKIKGEARMGLFTVPFEHSGEFKLKPGEVLSIPSAGAPAPPTGPHGAN